MAHDYLTQRGGAERVVAVMARAFPAAPLHTALFAPNQTFPDFMGVDVRVSRLNRHASLRRNHRLALPFLAGTMGDIVVDADVLLASSSGWAHGMQCTGRKVVYCHAPARWLYQLDRYVGAERRMTVPQQARRTAAATAIAVMGERLRLWDRRAAASASRYLVNSTVVQKAVQTAYGIQPEVLPPPPALLPGGAEREVSGIRSPYVLCVARLLPYKNVDLVIEAVLAEGNHDLVVVGNGPDRSRLAGMARREERIHLLGQVADAELRWLYRNSQALVAASFEDYGLSPLEAATFGRPTLALRDGGFLDTVVDGVTGLFFDDPTADDIAGALSRLGCTAWDQEKIVAHAASFAEDRFVARLSAVLAEESALV